MTGSNNYLNTNSVSGKLAYSTRACRAYTMVQCAHLFERSSEEQPNSPDVCVWIIPYCDCVRPFTRQQEIRRMLFGNVMPCYMCMRNVVICAGLGCGLVAWRVVLCFFLLKKSGLHAFLLREALLCCVRCYTIELLWCDRIKINKCYTLQCLTETKSCWVRTCLMAKNSTHKMSAWPS